MLYVSLALFIVCLVSTVIGFVGVGYASSGILGGFALGTLVLAVVALVRGTVVALTRGRSGD